MQLDLNTDPLPFEKAKFDFVVASEIIEHLHHPYQILGEIHRTLKDNGEFIITVPNIAALGKRVKLLLGGDPHAVYLPEEKDFHIREFTKGSLEKLLSFHGFRMESHEMLDLPAKNTVSKLIKKCFPSCKSHILYVAKKHYE